MIKVLISTWHEENKNFSFGPEIQAGFHTFGPISELGCLPFLVPAQVITDIQAQEYIQSCDILMIMGGHDVDPKYYGEHILYDSVKKNSYRDANEILLIKEAIRQGKKIVGICRGLQIINVALGGSLYQDVSIQCDSKIDHNQQPSKYRELSHYVNINRDSFLYEICKTDTVCVNSFHHQSISRLGSGLQAIAYSNDGVIEAIQNKNLNIYGVQWHPERSYFFDENSVALMKYFCSI